jgi:hypothetical protein
MRFTRAAAPHVAPSDDDASEADKKLRQASNARCESTGMPNGRGEWH